MLLPALCSAGQCPAHASAPPHQRPLLSHTHWRGPFLTLQPVPRPVRPSRLARHLRECHHSESTSPLSALLEGRCRHSGPGSPSERWGGERGCAALLSLALWGCYLSSPTLAPVISGGVLSTHGKLVITLMPVTSTTPTSYLQAVRVMWPQYRQPGI